MTNANLRMENVEKPEFTPEIGSGKARRR